jgi:hypothetical protein
MRSGLPRGRTTFACDVHVSGNNRRGHGNVGAKLTTLHPALLGVLCVMHTPSHAKSAKGAKRDRFTVANALGSAERAHHLCVRRPRILLACRTRRRRQACGISEPPQALAPGTNERREPSSRRYRGVVHSVRHRRRAPSNRHTATAAAATQLLLGAINHEVRQEIRSVNTTPKLDTLGLGRGAWKRGR